MHIGGAGSKSIVRVEGGWGKFGKIILIGTERLHLPCMSEGLGVQLGVAEHLFEFGVIEWVVHGGVDVFLRLRREGSSQQGGMRGGTWWGGRGYWLAGGGGLTSCREALRGGHGGRGASCGGRCHHTM